MLSKISLFLINTYQQHLSPYKGYCCAYKVYHDDISCSEYAKRSIEDLGIINSLPKINQRFEKCKNASDYIKDEYRDMENKKSPTKKCDTCGQCSLDACNVTACFSLSP